MIDEAAMSPQPFGTLNRLSIQEVWKTERGSFTPWLAENLDYRAERIGLDLELVATEVPVGPFRVDLVAQVTDIYDLVVVENQVAPNRHECRPDRHEVPHNWFAWAPLGALPKKVDRA